MKAYVHNFFKSPKSKLNKGCTKRMEMKPGNSTEVFKVGLGDVKI